MKDIESNNMLWINNDNFLLVTNKGIVGHKHKTFSEHNWLKLCIKAGNFFSLYIYVNKNVFVFGFSLYGLLHSYYGS